MPAAPFSEPVDVLLPAQVLVSGYCCLKNASMVALFCCALCAGFEGPLAMVMAPFESGFTSVMVSSSCSATDQPSGTGTVTPALEAVFGPELGGSDVGEGTGLGTPAGDGLDRPVRLLRAR